MASLQALRDTWFIDASLTAGLQNNFVPKPRYIPKGLATGRISNYTDNNLVTLLMDETYSQRWFDFLNTAPANAEILHSGLAFTDVRVYGKSAAWSSAVDIIKTACGLRGVKLYMLINSGLASTLSNTLPLVGTKNLYIYGDPRRPSPVGVTHAKFTVLRKPNSVDTQALVGSADINTQRWDRSSHSATDPERQTKNATHEMGVLIEGPAANDILIAFQDRWNDPPIPSVLTSAPPIAPILNTPSNKGTHSVQVLTTFGRTDKGYSWSPQGDFTFWAAYLNAIQKAQKYIYIEDQFFMAANRPGMPPSALIAETPANREADVFYQLGEAIARGVLVIAVVPGIMEDPGASYLVWQRDEGIHYLQSIKPKKVTGGFLAASLAEGTTPIYVHAKLLICDDEYVLVGSGNVNSKSQSHDGELSVGIVDSAEQFAKEVRKTVWGHHLGRAPSSLDNVDSAITTFVSDVSAKTHHIRPYVLGHAPGTKAPEGWGVLWVANPYSGPELRKF
jgi:phosphatidylserine/phosphatidylglycerophosphate/cardiolipin synthase-like enzyme